MGSKPLRIRFNEIDGCIKIYDGIRYLVLFGHLWYDEIYDRIRYLTSQKVLFQIVLLIILQESELIHIVLYRLKKYCLFILP